MATHSKICALAVYTTLLQAWFYLYRYKLTLLCPTMLPVAIEIFSATYYVKQNTICFRWCLSLSFDLGIYNQLIVHTSAFLNVLIFFFPLFAFILFLGRNPSSAVLRRSRSLRPSELFDVHLHGYNQHLHPDSYDFSGRRQPQKVEQHQTYFFDQLVIGEANGRVRCRSGRVIKAFGRETNAPTILMSTRLTSSPETADSDSENCF